MPTDCPECDGTGALVVQFGAWSRYYERCPVCDGTGVVEPPTEEEPTE
jgi:DnaJ-class molecular chaperone